MEAAGKRYIIHPSRKDEIKIWNLSDLHVGSASCAMDHLKRDIKDIETDPFSFWIGGGDFIDLISYTDGKRFDPDSVPDDIKVKDLGRLGRFSMEKVIKLLDPIKHKCLGCVLGNHEKEYMKRKEQSDLHSFLCVSLGVPNLMYSALFDVYFQRAKTKTPYLTMESREDKCSSKGFRIYIHHGAGFATTPGGKLNKLLQFMDMFDADIYFIGHVHDQTGKRVSVIGADADCKKIVERQKIGVISGSYLRTYTSGITTYGEQRGYRPTILGAATVTIKPETREMRGEI